jgi:hypothetical protein
MGGQAIYPLRGYRLMGGEGSSFPSATVRVVAGRSTPVCLSRIGGIYPHQKY